METSRSSSQAMWPELSPSIGLCYLGLFRVIPAACVSSWPLEGPPGTDGRKPLRDRQAWSQSDVAAHLLGQGQALSSLGRQDDGRRQQGPDSRWDGCLDQSWRPRGQQLTPWGQSLLLLFPHPGRSLPLWEAPRVRHSYALWLAGRQASQHRGPGERLLEAAHWGVSLVASRGGSALRAAGLLLASPVVC